HRTNIPSDALLSILLAAGILLLLILPNTVFPEILRTIVLLFSLAYLGMRVLQRPHKMRPARHTRIQEWLQLAALLLILLTLVPMPLQTTRLQGSTRYAQNETVDDAITRSTELGLTRDATKYGDGFAFTRNKSGTIRVLLILLAMHSAFFICRSISSERRELLLWILAFAGAAVALGGAISRTYVPQGHTLWWLLPTNGTSLPGPLGGFINPNHFAAYVALVTPCAMALAIGAFARRNWLRGLIAVALVFLMALGIMASHSRGGLLAYVCGIGTVGVVCMLRGRILAFLLVAAVLVGLAFWAPVIISDAYRSRLGDLLSLDEDDSYRTRMQAWSDSTALVARYPLLGAGANGYRMVFPQIRTASTHARMTHAENEYVQLLVDFGLIGALLFFAILSCIVYRVTGALFQNDAGLQAVPIAAAGTLSVVAVHSLVDFALHIPVYALTATLLIGLVGDRPSTAQQSPTPDPPWRPLIAPTSVVLMAAILVLVWGKRQHIDSRTHINSAGFNKMCRILRWAPTSPQGWERLGRRTLKEKPLEARMFGEACLTQAGTYDLKDYTLWYDIGMARLSLGDRQGAQAAQKHVQSLKDWYWREDIKMH
ncbi:MAG: O-antigen ligase family protein, partial [Kiritimatiellae bacterium]|nr:O-antigen ligase family protein [Kiritimatiellia bacterium]